MRRTSASTAAFLSAALALPAAPPASARAAQAVTPQFGSGVGLVRVTVVVRDKTGALVRGLKRGDFSVTEDDRPQSIETFEFEDLPTEHAPEPEPEPEPVQEAAPPPLLKRAPTTPTPALGGHRLVVLLFDTNGMEPEQLQRGVASARAYVEKRMTASDAVAVASVGSGLSVLQDFTADRALLGRALDRLVGSNDAPDSSADPGSDIGSDADAFAPDTSELDLFDIDRRLRAIEDLAKALSPVVQKKSVVYFSGGVSGAGADNQVQLRAAIDRSVKANLSIYPVDVRGLEAVVPGGDARQASAGGTSVFTGATLHQQYDQQFTSQDTLAALATDTGGRAFFDANDFAGVYERVVQDSSAYYILGYASTNPARDGRFRRVKIRVNRPELRLEHRSGYYADRDFQHSGHEDRERQLQDQLLTDLSSTDFPVWVQSAHFRTGENRYYVPVSIAVPGSALPPAPAGSNRRISLDLAGVVRDEAKRAVGKLRDTLSVSGAEVQQKSVQYRTGFTLPPGRYRLKVVVREDQGGGYGSFESELVVPDLRRTGPVKVSSVVFGTQLSAVAKGEAASPLARDGSELVPSVTHVVSTRQPLYFYYEVYDPARSPRGAVHLLTSIGFYRGNVRRYETPTVEVDELLAPDRQAAVVQLAVPAASLKPGLYTCQVNVIDDVAGTFTFPRIALLVRPEAAPASR
ncbi:MAG TPA: VWA domain-containing protein [Vicinamibacteria bacterium]|nr:VWA domain-containing protein [Vicinamibacteria bacterium]